MLKIILGAILLLGSLFAKETLTIYTYDSFAASWGPAPLIKKAFEKKYNCNLKFVATDSAIGAFRKVQLEGKNTKADIVLGLDTNTAELARKSGLFAKHHADTSKLDLPIKWNDDTFVPFDYSYFAFVYDSNKLKNPPSSFDELANMPKNFKIIIEDPRSSTPGLGLLLWIKATYKDKAYEYWKKLAPHILTITKGWSEAYNLFLKGEADMVLSYTTSPAYHIIEEKKYNYKTANFKAGHYAGIEIAGMLKSSKHKKLAGEFLDFMLTQQFANIIPTTNWSYPVIKLKKGLPKGFDSIYVPSKMILMDGKTVEKNRKIYINEWLRALAK
ncbi:MAG: thiamine ABC transporter substrate binding subunit [Epsilonproteobacteria bacterium]|nr:thiamine ABC transporter substrate binding subunit [Campylobacterota bacterium]